MQQSTSSDAKRRQLLDAPWFWGELSRGDEQELLRNKPDGTFLVRHSSTPGDFTISLRHSGSNKLIRINHKNGKYGFSLEDLPFDSVVELVAFYAHRSLQQYNIDLNVQLDKPCERSDTEAALAAKSGDELERLLDAVQDDYERASAEYDRLTAQLNQHADQLKYLHLNQKSSTLIMGMYEQQIAIGEEYSKELKSALDKQTLNNNFEMTRQMSDETRNTLSALDVRIKQCSGALMQIEKQIVGLRPELMYWHQRRQSVQRALQWRQQRSKAAGGAAEPLSTAPLDYVPPNGAANSDYWLMKPGATKQEAVALLSRPGVKDGTFLIRASETRPGFFALSLWLKGAIQNILIEQKRQVPGESASQFGLLGAERYFRSLLDLVRFYSYNSLAAHNQGLDTTLVYPAITSPNAPESHS